MKRYLLSALDAYQHETRATYSAMAEPMLPGHFRLFSHNDDKTFHVRVVGQLPNCSFYIVEAKHVPARWTTTLRPYADEPL